MANIELKIVALGDFSSVNNQIKSLQAQVGSLQKSVAGVGLSSNLSSQLKSIQSEFSSALMSSGNFVKSTVQLTSETEKFGKALQSGKLSLGQYFGIITGKSGEAQKAVNALAVEQVKLNNSIVQADITKQGVYSVYTPTKINEISKATEIAAAKQNIYNLAVREGSQSLINFGKNTQWAGRQLTVGLAMPVILFGSQAVKTFQQVNDELVRMQKVYGTGLQQPTKAVLDSIKKDVISLSQELARTMGISAKDTAAMAADLAATGKTGVDLLTATREAMRLSKLGEMSTQEAMQTTISLQNVYKLNTNELSGAINFLNAVENQTSTSLQDLAAGIPKVGPIVQQLGGSFKDTAVMMVAMKEAGVPAAQSANAIKSAIASMINPTKQAKEAFQGFGINLAGITASTKGNPIQMIMQLQAALKGLAPLAQSQLIEKLFGKFQEARIQALITNLGAVNSQTKAAFDLANASAPQLAAIAAGEIKVATESTTGKFKRAIETLKADLLPIGEKIMQVATTILNFGANIASFFNKLPGPIKSGLGILLTLGVISGPIIMITGLLANLMGQGMRVGYTLLGIIDGTKKWKDLMNPTSIAAKTATDVFNEGLLTNVASVDALNAALQKMIASLTEINMTRMGGTGGILGAVEQVAVAEAGLAGGKIPFKMPGMATGGFVPGSPANGDAYPAMLMGGEAVIPTKQAQQYAPFINAMIDGNLPGHKDGKYSTQLQRAHLVPGEKGVMGFGTSSFNQLIRSNDSGATGSQAAEEIKTMIDNNFYKPYVSQFASKVGASVKDTQEAMKRALEKAMNEFSSNPGTIYGGKTGEKKFEEITGKYIKQEFQNIHTDIIKSVDGTIQNQSLWDVSQGIQTNRSEGRSSNAVIDPEMKTSSGTLLSKIRGLRSATTTASGGAKARVSLASLYEIPTQFMSAEINKINEKTGKTLINETKVSAQKEAGIKSPSRVFEQEVGVPVAQGTLNGVEEGLSGSTGTSRIQGIFSKAFGANSKIGGMMSKFSGMGMMGKMGVGMGLGAVAQMASPLIDKLPGGNLISGAMSGAAMGAGFGPWGMAAGAALSLVSGGIKSLMAMEKLHKQESAADFKSSADAVQFLGGQVADVTDKMKQFSIINTNSQTGLPGIISDQKILAKGIQYTTTQLESFNSVVKSLTPDNPLALIIKQVKDAGDNQSAAKLAQQFATVQMAINGISQSQATQLAQLIMTVAGKNGATASVSAANQINAIKISVNAALPNTKQFQQVMSELINQAGNTTSMVTFENIIKGIGSSAATSAQQLQAMLGYYTSVGDTSNSDLVSMMLRSNKSFSGTDLINIQKSIANGNQVSLDTWKHNQKAIDQSPKLKSLNEQLAVATKKLNDAQSSSSAATSSATTATQSNIKVLTAEQKLLDAKLKSLQDLQKQQNQNTSYATTETDLKNQILMAQSTGDNLKAQMLKQQLLGTTRDYKLQGQVDAAQNAADANRLKVDNANSALTAAQNAATTGNTKALNDLTANILNLQAQIAALPKGQIISSVGAGTRSNPITNIDSSALKGDVLSGKGGLISDDTYKSVQKFISTNKLKKGDFFQYANQLYVVKSSGEYVRASLNSNGKDAGIVGAGGNGGPNGTYRYASGGHITGPGTRTSDSIPAMLSNGEYVINAGAVAHYGKGTFDALNAVKLARGGVARTNSSITYHKQHMNRQARHFASGGYVPSSVSGLMSLSHPAFASGGFVNAPVSANNGNIVYNINVSAPGGSANEIAKVVMETLKQADQRMAMSGRKTRVGN